MKPIKSKLIISGHIVEVFEYEKLNTQKPEMDMNEVRQGAGKYEEENYQQRQRERRNMVTRLINCNFTTGDKFLTLTFGDNKTDLKECNKYFNEYTKKMKRKYPGFKYVAVIEFQKRGAVHYHMLCSQPYIPQKELIRLWGNGHVWINRINHVDNLGVYVVKYMSKEADDSRLKGLNGYNVSKGLERPIEAKSWNGDPIPQLIDKLRLNEKKPVYKAMYTSEHLGQVGYAQYNLIRTKPL